MLNEIKSFGTQYTMYKIIGRPASWPAAANRPGPWQWPGLPNNRIRQICHICKICNLMIPTIGLQILQCLKHVNSKNRYTSNFAISQKSNVALEAMEIHRFFDGMHQIRGFFLVSRPSKRFRLWFRGPRSRFENVSRPSKANPDWFRGPRNEFNFHPLDCKIIVCKIIAP